MCLGTLRSLFIGSCGVVEFLDSIFNILLGTDRNGVRPVKHLLQLLNFFGPRGNSS